MGRRISLLFHRLPRKWVIFVENGESSSPSHQELMKQAENGALVSVNRVEQTEPFCKTGGKIIHAPLGVPHFPITIGGTHMGNNSKLGVAN
ncbi:hypothetical protein Hanom_Chr05g00463821 [Helianthus anomalus]